MGGNPANESSSAPTRDLKTVFIPLAAGVISAAATIGAAYLGGFFDVAKTNAVSLGSINLERLKFSNELIKGALATSNSANSLLFYADIGLLDGLNLDKVKDYAQRERDRIKSGGSGNSLLPSFDRTTRPKLWLDRDFVTAFAPHALPTYVNALVSTGNYLLQGFGIDENPKRLSMFLAQLAQETGGFFVLVENGNYSKARLLRVWPNVFNEQKAEQYANKPEAIFNLAYADKMGNGPEASGDGWKYRGRGFLQFTGRTNYERFSKEIGIDLVANPDLMSDPNVSLLIAASYWYNSGLNALADEDRLEDVTKKMFGVSSDMADRKRWVDLIAKLLAQKYP
ncbi:MAG TPA: glycoside hydrolase family 19 protein [Xanthobacteraceae bacterium]|nr:glycoside hydrolase family 19 protein [Xanthobacteraceae bacterium]